MRSRVYIEEVFPDGLWHRVRFEVSGQYRSATLYEPEEFPEIDVLQIWTCTEDGEDYELTGESFDKNKPKVYEAILDLQEAVNDAI